jgi:hypothetical protein
LNYTRKWKNSQVSKGKGEVDSKSIITIVVVAGLLAFAGYIAYKFIETIPSAIKLQEAINQANNRRANNLLEGN